MLVNLGTLFQKNESEKILPQLVAALYCSTRETDIAGWYRQGAILGVIFTEMLRSSRPALEGLTRTRLRGALEARLDAKQVNQIHLSFHLFPEDYDPPNPRQLIDETLYPDLFKEDKERRIFYFVKRLVDITGSILALVLGFPLLVAASLAIRLASKGPILTVRGEYDSPRLSEFPLRRSSSKGDRHGIFAENIFLRMLCSERKRSERSGRSFLLMLVNLGTLLQKNESEKILPQLAAALYCSTRETDIAGWYREGAILGVIFTEMHRSSRLALESLTRTRLRGALEARLDTKQVNQIHLSFHLFPEDHDPPNPRRLIDETLYPDLFEQDKKQRLFYFLKRLVDITGSILALVLGFPLLVAISLAIKLTSKGPVLFKQERIGCYGSRFTFLKFRSMKCGNDPSIHREYVRRFIAGNGGSAQSSVNSKAVYKIQDDPRVTRVGRFLRRTSLDELPQFINVLKGEMSLVGPRPPIPYELEAYGLWHRRRVLEAKPGITGLWQANGRSRLQFDDMVRLDLRYGKTQSLWLDIRIILKTPKVLLFGDGAY